VVAKLQKGFTLMLLRPIAASIPNYVHTSRSINWLGLHFQKSNSYNLGVKRELQNVKSTHSLEDEWHVLIACNYKYVA